MRKSHAGILGLLSLITVGAATAGAVVGPLSAAPADALGVLASRVGASTMRPHDPIVDQVLWEIRFPRVALGLVVGAALGCAGAAMQGTFANPLAEPGLIGVSSGAVVGAILQIVTGMAPLGRWSLPAAAFVGGLAAALVVFTSARSDGRTEVVTLVLMGVALNALLGSVIGLLTYLSDDGELRSITFWTLGSLAQATWAKVAVVAPLAVGGITAVVRCGRQLDLLSLGDRPAQHLGLRVERFRIAMVAAIAVLTAAAVAVSGIVLFIGLVIPHLVRLVIGPGHRTLLAASALAGAAVIVVADLVSRTVVAPAELPLGVVTALVGSPFFLWELRRTRASQGGWS